VGKEGYLSDIIKWCKEREIISISKGKFIIMSPKRCRERPLVNAAMEEEMRQLHVRLESM
jgi:hypothetical protein